MSNKHAYLIMAHNNFSILEKLIKLLDYEYNDLYIHIDKKIERFDFDYFEKLCIHSNVYFIQKRKDVQWGRQSLVLTEMLLFKTAYHNGDYGWFHLLSGVDLPILSAQEIYSYFFDKDKSYVYIQPNMSKWDKQRISRYSFSLKNEVLSNILYNIQERFSVDRVKRLVVKKGSNWCSLTRRSVEILLVKEKEIKKMTFASSCADEVYKQTILYNYAKDTIFFDEHGNTTNLRYVDWSSGGNHPKILDETDLENITTSGKLFARKFDEKKSKKILNYIGGK